MARGTRRLGRWGFAARSSLPAPARAFYGSPVSGITGHDESQGAGRDILPELNARVHEVARRFEGPEPDPGRDLWDFSCECGAPSCRIPVSLTLADYEALRARGRPLLAPGHRLVA